MKELFNGNSQTITQLLDSGYGRAVVASTDNIIDGRLGNAAHTAKLIYRNLVFGTQLQNPFLDCFTNVHGHHLTT